jgi:multidrug efflux pump subunit AcrB
MRRGNSQYCVKNWLNPHPHDLGQLRQTLYAYKCSTLTEAYLGTMTATGERTMKTMNQAEAEDWSEKVRRRTERIFGLVLLILLAAILLFSATLFFTARTSTRPLPSSDTQESGDSDKEQAAAALTPV